MTMGLTQAQRLLSVGSPGMGIQNAVPYLQIFASSMLALSSGRTPRTAGRCVLFSAAYRLNECAVTVHVLKA
jgi:hypothetical protein